MSRSRNEVLVSVASSLTSCSSEASLELYEKRLKPSIETIRMSPTGLQGLVATAEKIIDEKFSPDPQSTYTYKEFDAEGISVELDKIMIAMLACVEECGGESGKRYVASAIVACSKEEDVVGALAALGTTWLTHFLFAFKTGCHRGTRNQRKSSVSDDLMIRDGYTCIVTGAQDEAHPAPIRGGFKCNLVAAQILRGRFGNFGKGQTSQSIKSALRTFDILVNFTGIPVKTLDELHTLIDHPSNGIMLEPNARVSFNNFTWCLKATEEKHAYNVKIFKDHGLVTAANAINRPITFMDHSHDFSQGSTGKRRNCSLELPNRDFSAIHAAIAEVLNMSGAGRFFDVLLNKYNRGSAFDVRSWPELEALMGERLLSESVTQIFQLAKVY
ncbi:hypothetical protein M413DRAFT_261455 [Hebeloma cylindrosporum]|uniref:Uncharacterized protein n=1 Tax=Hebeloma cylindrosporum TaxID=76867 RepID=A0A0C3CRN0_HEBCY|nr:hypothetical protein M413DRAFT_261455 [Hebeloma cylindrosporum h7]